jgi:hypothetical protein
VAPFEAEANKAACLQSLSTASAKPPDRLSSQSSHKAMAGFPAAAPQSTRPLPARVQCRAVAAPVALLARYKASLAPSCCSISILPCSRLDHRCYLIAQLVAALWACGRGRSADCGCCSPNDVCHSLRGASLGSIESRNMAGAAFRLDLNATAFGRSVRLTAGSRCWPGGPAREVPEWQVEPPHAAAEQRLRAGM